MSRDELRAAIARTLFYGDHVGFECPGAWDQFDDQDGYLAAADAVLDVLGPWLDVADLGVQLSDVVDRMVGGLPIELHRKAVNEREWLLVALGCAVARLREGDGT